MKPAAVISHPGHAPLPISPGITNGYTEIKKYYDIAGPDYAMWSRRFNMHFGYCRKFSNIFFLEKMLENMNSEVLGRLHINPKTPSVIADLGCGAGTVARFAASTFPLAHITGITIVDSQIKKGNELVTREGLQRQVTIQNENFEQLNAGDGSFTHAYAIESACHANGPGKELFIKEMTRVLQPGGRFCIADGFIKHSNRHPRLFNFLYNKIIRYWALPCFSDLPEFLSNLEKYGCTEIKTEEISYRIAPSVAYVPWTTLKFLIHELWKKKSLRLHRERRHNVMAPLLGMLLGLFRNHFGYYLISGKKTE